MDNLIKKKLNQIKNNWEIENLFYEKVHPSRIQKLLNHYELLKKTKNIKGAIIGCGVLKGNSLLRFAQFRDYLGLKKTVYGFDAFGSFPRSYKKTNNAIIKKEENFAKIYDKNIGKGNSKKFVKKLLDTKKIKNYLLIEGDVLTSIDKFLSKNKNLKISMLHLDMDVYHPTQHVLEKFYKFMSKNAIVIIDDFKIHPGATHATNMFIKKKKIKIKVLNNARPTYYFTK
jgi:hypothetical protein